MNIEKEDFSLKESQNRDFPIKFTFSGNEFILHKNVFSPEYFTDYHLYIPHIPLKQGQRMLDMGCGCGLIGITLCIKNNPEFVMCADISEPAVKNTVDNIKLHKLSDKIKTIQSDLFSSIPESEKFDLIFYNFPYFDLKRDNPSLLDLCSYDYEYKNIKKFIIDAFKRLTPDGRVMLGFSSSNVSLQHAKERFNEIGYDAEIFFHGTDENGIKQELLNIVKI